MQELGPAPDVLTTAEVIAKYGAKISDVMRQEMSDESDPDRVWILRKIHKNYLYYRGLQYFAPQFFQGLLDATGISGGGTSGDEYGNAGLYDYYQNHYRGYCRKLEAILGNRMPNVIAMPDATDDEQSARATQSANNAALYIRDKCELPMKNLSLVFGLFNFGTMFWHLDWVEDSDKYGFTEEENFEAGQEPLGNASFNCPQCSAATPADPQKPQPPPACPECGAPMSMENYQPPTMADAPKSTGVKNKPKGALEITLHDASEVSVPLDATSVDSDDCPWLRYERDKHKGTVLQKWDTVDPQTGETKNPLRDSDTFDGTGSSGVDDTVASQYAESIRSAMASPIGLVRSKRANRWVECDTWWKPAMYQMIDDAECRAVLKRQYPKGLRICSVRGKILDLREEKLQDRWQETKPEPSARIMADPLGDDWVETQDILTNTLNQANETIERSNEPGFGDARYIDFDAYQQRRDMPTELIPALKPAGGSLQDIIYRPEPNRFSDQIPPFRQGVEESAKNISGLTDPIWGGGDAEEPTARQAELKKNAALMQLGVPWTYIGKSAEKVNMKGCRLLAEYEDGVLAFTKQNQFGGFDSMAVVVEDLRNGKYHFEADEAIPMTWGQMRDLLMWMLDKPAELLEMWGFTDPLNIFEFKQLLGMPGQHTPKLDDRNKMMDVIAQLLNEKPAPPPPDPANPTAPPGPLQSSIQPSWSDDKAFGALLAKAYLQVNWKLEKDNPDGFKNVELWGQAQEKMANQPPPPPPPKTSVTYNVKAQAGTPATDDVLAKQGLIDQGVTTAPDPPVPQPPPPLDPNRMPPPGAAALASPAPPIQ